MAGRAVRCAVAALALAVAAAGCTGDPDPSPSPTPTAAATEGPAVVARTGDRIAVVVPPATVVARAEGAALAQAATALAADPPADVLDVRVVRAVSEAFVRDLANLAADDGYDVVCIVGTGSATFALELARTRRDVRVCTTDARIEGGPVNLIAVGLDPVVLVEAGAIAIGTTPAPVGILLSPQLGDVEALTAAFTAAVAPPTQPSPPPTGAVATPSPLVAPTPAASPPGPTSPQLPFVTAAAGVGGASQVVAGEQLAQQRPTRVLQLTTPAGYATASAVTANGAGVVGVADWLVDEEGELAPNLLVAFTVDWDELLREAITGARAAEPVQLDRRGNELLGAVAGQAQGATPALERTVAFLEQDDG